MASLSGGGGGGAGVKRRRRRSCCELCRGEAAVYCAADAAFLCWACDAAVHRANFLAARHVRSVACAGCRCLDADRLFTGSCAAPARSFCRPCRAAAERGGEASDSGLSSAASSSSGSCVSTAESAARSRRRRRTC